MTEKNNKILFITGNPHKLKEARKILTDFEVDNKEVDLDEIQGTTSEIVEKKAKLAYEMFKCPLIVEDVSLEFDGLNGLPGPYIKDFLDKLGKEGLVQILEPFENKSAKAICTIGYIDDNELTLISGEVKGEIVEVRGESEFGWDPIFLPDGRNETYAEMNDKLKNSISHRKMAFDRLKEYLYMKYQ